MLVLLLLLFSFSLTPSSTDHDTGNGTDYMNYGGWTPGHISLQTNPIVANGIEQALTKLNADGGHYELTNINKIDTQVRTGVNYLVEMVAEDPTCEYSCIKHCDCIVHSRIERKPPDDVTIELTCYD